MNFDIKTSSEKRLIQLCELDEIRNEAYKTQEFTKKGQNDKKIIPRYFKKCDQVMLFNSRLKLFPGKLKSKWLGTFKIKEVSPYRAITLWDPSGGDFTVNGQCCKPYLADALIDESDKIPLSSPPTA